jgi:ubiquinone/menaquinone biosynthesis C-methylase UbiE
MAASFNTQQNENVSSPMTQALRLPRLFNFDLPRLKKTGQILPEQIDISVIHDVLDIACGYGAWAIAAAQVCPQMQFTGSDSDARALEEARAQAETYGVHNVSFTLMNPFDLQEIPDNSFDLVNARFIVGLIPAEAWPQAMREFMRVTRPGGYIQLTETDLPITSGPACAKFEDMISRAYSQTKRSFSPEGRLLSVTPMLKGLLQDAGCGDVQQTVYFVDFSAGLEAHKEITDDVASTYQLVQPWLIQVGATTQEEVEQVYQQMLAEMQASDFCGVAFYLSVCGVKPA